jgi:hypothetical protein
VKRAPVTTHSEVLPVDCGVDASPRPRHTPRSAIAITELGLETLNETIEPIGGNHGDFSATCRNNMRTRRRRRRQLAGRSDHGLRKAGVDLAVAEEPWERPQVLSSALRRHVFARRGTLTDLVPASSSADRGRTR